MIQARFLIFLQSLWTIIIFLGKYLLVSKSLPHMKVLKGQISLSFQQFIRLNLRENAMLHISALSPALSFSAITTDPKIHSSIGTEDTSDDAFKKKISLCSCSSSISLEQSIEHTKEKELFARYLSTSDKTRAQRQLKEMRDIYQSSELEPSFQHKYLVDISESESDLDGHVFSFFIDIWLRHMGYGTKKNRSSLLARVKLLYGYEALKSFNRLYENLNSIPLSKKEKKELLVKTCKNGWDFFARELIQYGFVSRK